MNEDDIAVTRRLLAGSQPINTAGCHLKHMPDYAALTPAKERGTCGG